MLDYKLFEKVTYESNGKRAGYNMREYPQYVDEMKELVKDFNTFTTNLINYFNSQSNEEQLKTIGVTNHWQNSGRYNPYFWNKIIKSSETEDYDGIAIWLALDAKGLHIAIGTTGTLESIQDNNFINQVNQNIIQQCTLDIEGFERQLDGKYATYQYKKDEESLEDFFKVLKYVYPIYENTLTTYKNKINEQEFRRYYQEFVDTLPLQDMGRFAKLYTSARNTPFKVYKNSQNSIVVKAFTDNASPMVITANQLSKVLFEGERYLYASYEPILIERIRNNNYVGDDEIENEILESLNPQPIESTFSTNNKIKNIILYGSPGVGKTHNTNKLINLIENRLSEKEIFETIKNNEQNNGINISDIQDRVKFITFHQSFGYEDFIEGFRPNEDGNIELEDGIFKRIAIQAKENLLKSNTNQTILFNDAINLLLKEKIENEELVNINMKSENNHFSIYDYNDKTLYFEKKNGGRSHTLSLRTLEQMYNAEENSIIHGGLAPYYNPLLGELLVIKRNAIQEQVERKNYYLVIDEINRGNISKIFGELITLIEEDKRDTLEVILPYSKKPFKIPSNLYIIGTMNSTDKSISLIDIALRRRFTFIKMQPNSDLVPEIARDLFVKLNEEITKRLGEDYQIGHSYFMNIQDNNDLEFALAYKIKPLLEEYFYGDEQGYKNILTILENDNI